MKRIVLAIFVILAVGALYAQESESFTITVTVNYIDFSLRNAADSAPYPNWPIDNVNAGATSEMTTTSVGTHILVDNESNVALDFETYSTSLAPTACGFGTPTAWVAGAASGVDTYLLEMGVGDVSTAPATGDYDIIDGASLPAADLVNSTVAGESWRLYSKLTAPLTASDGCEHTITVFVVATTP
ncbi:hypothetical protein KAH81_08440 [bacterium]|nr:hypothetical protein [bacterium]